METTNRPHLTATGLLTRLGITTCNDAATHLLHVHQGTIRLAAANRTVSEIFQRLEGKRMPVTVEGELMPGAEGPQCAYLNVGKATPGYPPSSLAHEKASCSGEHCSLANVVEA